MASIAKREWVFLAIVLIYSFVPTFGGLIRVVELSGGPAIAPPNLRAVAAPFPIILHILSSFLFCLLGALQFLPSLRRSALKVHRATGRLVIIAGLASAATGLWMTLTYPIPDQLQGDLLYWARIALSLLMAGLIAYGIVAIRSRNFFGHGAAMLRAYAIGQGASTQTLFGLGWIIASGTEAIGPQRDGLMVGAWILNLLIADMVIRRFLRGHKRTPGSLRVNRARSSEHL